MSEIPRPVVLNQSSLKSFQNCQRLYAWEHVQGLTPIGRRSVLEIGSATHTGLAMFHGGATLDEAIEGAERHLEERGGPTSSFDDKTVEEAIEVVRNILPAYVEHWKGKGELWTPLNQEIEALVVVGDPRRNVWLRLRADNLSTAKGGLYLVDYKTAGRLDPRDLLKYEMDVQITAYIYGLTKYLTRESEAQGGEPIYVRGAIIDVLVKTKVPQFVRELFTRSEEELLEFEAEFVEIASRIRDQEERVRQGEDWKLVFPKSTEHCFRYGTCAFRDLCLKDTPVRRKLYNQREPDYVDIAQAELLAEWQRSRDDNHPSTPSEEERP